MCKFKTDRVELVKTVVAIDQKRSLARKATPDSEI